MKKLVAVWMLGSLQAAFSQNQSECAVQAEAQMKEVAMLTSVQAGQATYTKFFEGAKQCVDRGKCIKSEALVAMSEMMVDQKIVAIQRQKVAALRAFFIEARPYENDACAMVGRFPKAIAQMTTLNERQLDRFVQLSAERVKDFETRAAKSSTERG